MRSAGQFFFFPLQSFVPLSAPRHIRTPGQDDVLESVR